MREMLTATNSKAFFILSLPPRKNQMINQVSSWDEASLILLASGKSRSLFSGDVSRERLANGGQQ